MIEAAEISEELRTLEARVRYLIETFRERWPKVHENYTLLTLLYLAEFDGLHFWDDDFEQAAQGELVNITSLHRAITLAKKAYQDEGDRARSDTKEAAYREALAPEDVGLPEQTWLTEGEGESDVDLWGDEWL